MTTTFIIGLLVAYFIETVAAYIVFSHAGQKRYKPLTCFLIIMVFHYFAMLINVLGSNTIWLNMIVFTITTILSCYLSFKMKFSKACLYSIILVVICTICEYAVEIFVASLMGIGMQEYMTNEFMMVMILAFGKGLYFITALILTKFIKREKQVKIPLNLYLYPLSVFSTLVVIWYVCRDCEVNAVGQLVLSIVTILLFVPVVFLFLSYQQSVEKENELLKLKSDMEKAETEKNYYSIIEKQNEDLKRYADDAQNHLETIKNLNTDPKIEEYINTMLSELTEYSKDKNNI